MEPTPDQNTDPPVQDPTGANTRLDATCGGCDQRWTGMSMAHCAVCHQTFGSVNSFTRHRTGGTCTNPADLGLYFNTRRRCWSESYGGTTFVGVERAAARIDEVRATMNRIRPPRPDHIHYDLGAPDLNVIRDFAQRGQNAQNAVNQIIEGVQAEAWNGAYEDTHNCGHTTDNCRTCEGECCDGA